MAQKLKLVKSIKIIIFLKSTSKITRKGVFDICPSAVLIHVVNFCFSLMEIKTNKINKSVNLNFKDLF